MPSVHLYPAAALALSPARPHIDFMRVDIHPRAGRGLPNIARFRSKAREAAGFGLPRPGAAAGGTLWRLSIRRIGRALLQPLLAVFLVVATAGAAHADGLFGSPGLGLTPVPLPRTAPKAPATGVPALDANQCRLLAGTCPLGRIQRSGSRCYCAAGGGTVRQGETQKRKQGARPSLDP